MQFADTTYGTVKNGVLVLSGYVTSVRMEMGCLVVKDGLRGTEIERRFPRASCPVSRLIAVRPEGGITFAALRWMHNAGITLVNLDYDGTPIAVTVPPVTVPAALRRAQAATSIETRLGKAIAGNLINAKIAGQIATLRTFGRDTAANEINAIGGRLQARANALDLLGAEGMASAVYWQ